VTLKHRNAPKVTRSGPSSVGGIDKKIALLTRERDEALEQHTATSEVLKVISSCPGQLGPVFDAILANAVRICEARFGNLALFDGKAMRVAALYNAPHEFAEMHRRDPTIPLELSVLGPLVRTKKLVHVRDLSVAALRQLSDGEGRWRTNRNGGSHAQGKRAYWRNRHLPPAGPSVYRQTDRAAYELRRSGGYRH
jgi:hypothetical protein